MVYRLRKDSDFHKRVERLMDNMEKLQLVVETVGPYMLITDLASTAQFQTVKLLYNENSEPLSSIPPTVEYKLIVDVDNPM